ncbi:MAG: TldD/PmbA family protein [Candidatus Njordarchaeota archaeon]
MEEKLNELISIGEKIVEKSRDIGADDLEIYISFQETTNVRLITNYITTQSGIDVGAGIRVAIGKNVGFASVSSTDIDKLLETAKMAVKIAKTKGEDPNFRHLPDPMGAYSRVGIFDEHIYAMDVYEIAEKVKNVIKIAKDRAAKIRKIDVYLVKANYAFAVINSRGVNSGDYGAVFFNWLDLDVEDAGKHGKGMDFYITRKFNEAEFLETVNVATNMAREGLEAKNVGEAFEGDVLIEPMFLESLIWPLWYNISALNVQEKRSRFIGMIGKKVASDNLTLYDDGTLPEGVNTSACDDEGIPMRKKIVIEKGILKTYLYDTYTAYREEKESTGNAKRRGYRSQPSPQPTNFVFVPNTNKKLNDLIGEIDKGVLLRGEAMGSHLINPIKGSMAITCLNALYIEDGEVKYPLKAVSMSSDYFEFLNKIEKVGADQRIVYQGKLAPIIVRGVHFS